MAKPTDTAFGSGFNAETFRAAIQSAMQMGAPPETARRATFVFASPGRTYVKDGLTLTEVPRLDRDGRPFDPTIAVREIPGAKLQLDCAIEISRSDDLEQAVGTLRRNKATVTLLDEQYAQAQGARELLFNKIRYVFGYEPEGLGLFDVGVHTMIFYAADEGTSQ